MSNAITVFAEVVEAVGNLPTKQGLFPLYEKAKKALAEFTAPVVDLKPGKKNKAKSSLTEEERARNRERMAKYREQRKAKKAQGAAVAA